MEEALGVHSHTFSCRSPSTSTACTPPSATTLILTGGAILPHGRWGSRSCLPLGGLHLECAWEVELFASASASPYLTILSGEKAWEYLPLPGHICYVLWWISTPAFVADATLPPLPLPHHSYTLPLHAAPALSAKSTACCTVGLQEAASLPPFASAFTFTSGYKLPSTASWVTLSASHFPPACAGLGIPQGGTVTFSSAWVLWRCLLYHSASYLHSACCTIAFPPLWVTAFGILTGLDAQVLGADLIALCTCCLPDLQLCLPGWVHCLHTPRTLPATTTWVWASPALTATTLSFTWVLLFHLWNILWVTTTLLLPLTLPHPAWALSCLCLYLTSLHLGLGGGLPLPAPSCTARAWSPCSFLGWAVEHSRCSAWYSDYRLPAEGCTTGVHCTATR